jgi:type IV pilus assembly protein PilA
MKLKRQDGFTLIELLVVVLIIAILAAIAIPVFLRQRDRGYEAQARSTLKHAANAVESYATRNAGDFSGLDTDDGSILDAQEGFRPAGSVTISIAATPSEYCITATHPRLAAGHPWRISTYNSEDGSPSPVDADTCP